MAKRRSAAHLRRYQFKKRSSRRASGLGGMANTAIGIAKGVGAYAVVSMIPGVFGLSGQLKNAVYLAIAAALKCAGSFATKGLFVAGAILGLGLLGNFMGSGSAAAGALAWPD